MAFYAEFCPYGVRTMSWGDRLMKFETREERDEMVERINEAHSFYHPEGVCASMTTREAHRYNLKQFGTDAESEAYGLTTCAGRHFFEIPPRYAN